MAQQNRNQKSEVCKDGRIEQNQLPVSSQVLFWSFFQLHSFLPFPPFCWRDKFSKKWLISFILPRGDDKNRGAVLLREMSKCE